jgi:hypothetical protein
VRAQASHVHVLRIAIVRFAPGEVAVAGVDGVQEQRAVQRAPVLDCEDRVALQLHYAKH